MACDVAVMLARDPILVSNALICNPTDKEISRLKLTVYVGVREWVGLLGL